MTSQIINGDSLQVLKEMPENSIDAIVTDPPYGLGKEPDIVKVMQSWCEKGYHEVTGSGFMGKKWDAFVPQPIFWKEALRVLKPGGHILCACATRTQDWMAASLRFAGFEIRDVICWHYGSGFPKSLDVSKAIDKHLGAEREVVGENKYKYKRKRRVPGQVMNTGFGLDFTLTIGGSPQAQQYNGFGTALKPATELWTLARKPLTGTVAENVLEHGTGGLNIDGCRIGTGGLNIDGCRIGTGGLNIDGCRIGTEEIISHAKSKGESFTSVGTGAGFNGKDATANTGRFPANVIFDEFMAEELDKQTYDVIASRFFYVAKPDTIERNNGTQGMQQVAKAQLAGSVNPNDPVSDRFLSQPMGNFHPTVKPVSLMRYLIRLITPPDSTILDPFNGSGTTGIAAKMEQKNYIGIEQDADYCAISEARISATVVQHSFFTPPTNTIQQQASAQNQQSFF